MEKVKLPREVAEAVTAYRDDAMLNNWKGAILKVALEPERYIKVGTDDVIKDYVNTQTIDIFLQALVNGYEVEQKPEDRIKAMFGEACKEEMDKRTPTYGAWWEGRRMTIIDTLNALNIKIEGVNA